MPTVTTKLDIFNVKEIRTHANTRVRDILIIDEQGNATLITCQGAAELPILFGSTGQQLQEPTA